ncbi:MAG: Lrp/AsnC family transcriptional regulator [Candidatus Saliniplasma sp.]
MEPLDDVLNLKLLRYLVPGRSVHANISHISKELGIHRATAKRKLKMLYDEKILNPPLYPFPYLFEKYPLLVLVKADMPRTAEAANFYKDDSHIFAAFSCMEGSYNTLLIEFFKDLESYHSWREQIVKDKKIPSRENRVPAHAEIFSNKLSFKYDPNCFIRALKKQYEEQGYLEMNGVQLDDTTFKLLELLVRGDCFRTNASAIGREINADRKTVRRRIETLLDRGVIEEPRCFFKNLLVPPNYNLVVSLLEVKSNVDNVKRYIANNDHVPRAVETSTEKYNFLIFSAFKTIEDFFNWGEKLNSRFPGSIGAISNTILSSKMIHTIKPHKVSLGLVERRLWDLEKSTQVGLNG